MPKARGEGEIGLKEIENSTGWELVLLELDVSDWEPLYFFYWLASTLGRINKLVEVGA